MSTFFPTPEDDEQMRQLWQSHLAAQPAAEQSATPAAVQTVEQPAQPVQPEQPTESSDSLAAVLKQLAPLVTRKPSPEDQQMQQLWADNERQALQKLNGDRSSENWAVGLGTAIPMLAGIIADSATKNAYGVRGTGLGKIAEAGAQNAQQLMHQQDVRREQNQSLAQAAAGIRKSYADKDYDKLTKLASLIAERDRINNQNLALGYRGSDQQLKADAQSFRLDPNNPQAQAARAMIYKYAPQLAGTLDGMGTDALSKVAYQIQQNTKDAHFGTEYAQAVQKAGGESAASTGARQSVEHQWAPVNAQDEVNKQTQLTPVLAERQNGGAGTLSAEQLVQDNPSIDFGDQKQLQKALSTRNVNQKTLDDVKAANRGSEIIERLHETAKQYQDLSVAEKAGAKGAELRRQYDAHAEEYAGVLGKLSGSQSESTRQDALNLVPNIHNPYALNGIKGLWSSIEANANGNLSAIGGRARPPEFMQAAPNRKPAGSRSSASSASDWSKYGL